MNRLIFIMLLVVLCFSCEKNEIALPAVEVESDLVLYQDGNIIVPGNNQGIEFENSYIYSAPNSLTIQADGNGVIALNNQYTGGIFIETGRVVVYDKTEFSGKITIADDNKDAKEGDIRYNSITKKHQGYNGISWNDFY